MLTSGWIPDLFEAEDVLNMVGAVRNEAKAAGVMVDDQGALFDYMLQRIKRNLHVVLCFSPVGDLFRIRARRFPGIVNCTSIDRFMAWPRDALISVAERFLGDVELESDEIASGVAEFMAEAHLSVTEKSAVYLERQRRYNYTTPKSFLELISLYRKLLSDKREETGKNIKRLDDGLAKLMSTGQTVDELKVDLQHTMEQVAEQVAETEEILKVVNKEKADAEVQEQSAAKIAAHAAEESEKAMSIKADADKELAKAKPAMEAAFAALDELKKAKSELDTLKSLGKPPEAVTMVTAATLVMVYKEKKDLSWKRSQKMMKNVLGFMDELMAFAEGDDIKTLEDWQLAKIEKEFLSLDYFNKEAIALKSGAAASLCEFVVNCFRFNRIFVKVDPLIKAADAAEEKMNAALAEKDAATTELQAVRDKVAGLEAMLAEKTAAKEKVEADAAACNARLGLANRLVNGLQSENERWGKTVKALKDNERMLIGDALIGSAFVSYLGAFDYTYRNELWQQVWLPKVSELKVPISEGMDPLDVLVSEAAKADMMAEGLPSDRISLENGAITVASKRWPLLIDPQLQGIKWLRKREEENNLTVTQLTQPKWTNTLSQCITNGFTLILENCGQDLDATLDPVLARAVTFRGRSQYLNIGGEDVEYSPSFQLYLQTKLNNPHYKPETQAQCTLINFIATEEGLKDQLLAQVVNKEKPDLEQKKQELQEAFNDYQVRLLKLEDDLLNKLANAPEDILSDVELIEGLEKTKQTATEIEEAVKAGRKTEEEINAARQVYIPVAEEGAMLYFMITALSAIDHMYQYSLDQFMLFFFKSIREAEAGDKIEERVDNLKNTLRLVIFTWVSRGLFEEHKLVLLSQLTF